VPAVYVFAPINVSEFVPDFVSENAPLITPLRDTALGVVMVVLPVITPFPVNVSAPVFPESPSVNDPDIEYPFPIVRAAVPSLDTDEPANVTRPVVAPKAELLPTYTAPALKVAPPVNVFVPLNVNAAAPAFVRLNPPPKAPVPNTTSLSVVNVAFEVRLPLPLNVNVPPATAPKVTAPPNAYPFVNARFVAESLASVAPLTVRTPVPNAALSPAKTVPPLTVAPPLNVLTPPTVRVPVPVCANAPVPLITPVYDVTADPPTVSVLEPKLTNPAPAKLPIVSPRFNLSVAEAFTVTAATSAIADPPPSVRVPAFTTAAPVNVFAPLNVNSPAPSFVNP
jgi:hypothetical protein